MPLAPVIIDSVEKTHRKAKITDENREESRLLKVLWNDTGHAGLSQDEFGYKFGIGSQSAVGFFLNGKSAISLKAAKGFATGLGCPISAFSQRLADEVQAVSAVSGLAPSNTTGTTWPFATVTQQQYFEVLSQGQRDIIEAMTNTLVNSKDPPEKQQPPANMPANHAINAKRA